VHGDLHVGAFHVQVLPCRSSRRTEASSRQRIAASVSGQSVCVRYLTGGGGQIGCASYCGFPLQVAEAALLSAREKLNSANATLAALEAKFAELQDTEATLELRIRAAQSRSEHAARMLVGLQHEVAVWELRLVDLQTNLTTCVSDCTLSVACMVYGSALPPAGRKQLLDAIRTVLRDNCMPTSTLGDDVSPLLFTHASEQQRRQWRNHGLPASIQSHENAAMLFGGKPVTMTVASTHSPQSPSKEKPSATGLWTQKVLSQSSVVPCIPLTSQWPLIVDPQGIGVRYD
jgi:hypothetical protein